MSEPTFKITVRYRAGHKQDHRGLSAFQAEQAIGAFFRDLLQLKGTGLTGFAVQIERDLQREACARSGHSFGDAEVCPNCGALRSEVDEEETSDPKARRASEESA